jgi:hypothetical protein
LVDGLERARLFFKIRMLPSGIMVVYCSHEPEESHTPPKGIRVSPHLFS